MYRYAFHPDTRVSDSGLFEGAILKHIEDLLAKIYHFKNDRDMTISDLCAIKDDEIETALRKPGVRKEKREGALFDIKRAREFAEPVGTRFPLDPARVEGYVEDSVYEEEDQILHGMYFSDEEIGHLEKLLKQDRTPQSLSLLKKHEKTFRESEESRSVLLVQGRSVLHWEEQESGYKLRVTKDYCTYCSPSIDVLRRWDTIIQGVLVSIIRVSKRPGAGAYYILVNTDTKPEILLADEHTFKSSEDALIEKLNLKATGLPETSYLNQDT